MSEDFYEVLGVDRDANEDDINRAFRRKAAEYHPDVSDEPDAEEKFKRIQKAKQVLTDEEKRSAYDQMGHERFTQADKHGGFDGRGGGDPFGGRGESFGGFGDIFDQFFGGGSGRRRNGPQRGSDLRTGMTIDLEQAYHGASRQVTLNRPTTCSECDGAGHPPSADVQRCPECDGRGQVTRVRQSALGQIQQTQACPRCNGDGQLVDETCGSCRGEGIVQEESSLSVDIPAGIRDGQTLRMEGEGAPGDGGGPNGDLLIEVRVNSHPDFERSGDDLHAQEPISFPQAVFGDTVTIDTFDGQVELEIPPGTQSGEVLKLAGKGMPHLRGRGHGDLLMQIQVVTPQRMSTEEREALEAFAEAGGEDIDIEQGLFDRIRDSL